MPAAGLEHQQVADADRQGRGQSLPRLDLDQPGHGPGFRRSFIVIHLHILRLVPLIDRPRSQAGFLFGLAAFPA